MILSKETKFLPDSQIEVVIKVSKDFVGDKYRSKLKEYSSNFKIQGFRKGKVPISVIESKYSENLRSSVLKDLVQESLEEFFKYEVRKPLSYFTPVIKNKELILDIAKDFEFTFVYETYPEFEVPSIDNIMVKVPEVLISNFNIEEELKNLQMQSSIVVKDKIGIVEQDSIVKVDFVELDDFFNEIAATRRQDFVFTVGKSETYYDFDIDIVNMKIDEEKIVEKFYDQNYKFRELAGSLKRLKIKVKELKKKIIPIINDEFAKNINDSFNSLNDLKSYINSDLFRCVKEKKESLKLYKIFFSISENLNIAIPSSMIKAEIDSNLKNMAEYNSMGFEEFKNAFYSSDDIDRDIFKDEIYQKLKAKLIMQKMVDLDPLQVTENDLKEEIIKRAKNAKLDYEDVKEFYEKHDLLTFLKNGVKTQKVKIRILKSIKEVKDKQISFTDFINCKIGEL